MGRARSTANTANLTAVYPDPVSPGLWRIILDGTADKRRWNTQDEAERELNRLKPPSDELNRAAQKKRDAVKRATLRRQKAGLS